MTQQHPITITNRLAHPVVAQGERLEQILLCSLKARDLEITERAPLSLMLCLDTSGSMMGRPLDLVIESIEALLQQLNVSDRLGMVTFNNRAKLISSMRPINEEGRAFYQGVLRGIQALGSTNMSAGLELALGQLAQENQGPAHLLVFSDGKPNRGEVDTGKLHQIVSRLGGNHLSVSCLGFSAEHDEDLLQGLAHKGQGSYAYIESAETIPIAFAKELGGLLSIVGHQVQLFMRPMAGCSIVGMRNDLVLHYTGQGLRVDLPNMLGGAEYHLFLDLLQDAPEKMGSSTLVEMELRYVLPGSHPQQVSLSRLVEYTVQEKRGREVSPFVATRLLLYEVAVAWRESHVLATQERYSEAIALLQEQKERLFAAPGFREAKGEIRNWFEQIVDEVAILSEYPKGERYQQVRKVAKIEMSDPSGIFRRSGTSFVKLNTTQRSMLGKFMLKAMGMPHAYLRLESVPAGCTLEVGHIFPLLGEVSLGRMGEIAIDHSSLGKRHIRLVATPKGYILIDLLSVKPSSVNGDMVLQPTPLKDGDRILVGEFLFRFHMGLAPGLKRELKF